MKGLTKNVDASYSIPNVKLTDVSQIKKYLLAGQITGKDIREMGSVLRNTSIFIAADNGVMHLASASLIPTIGFFSVTNEAIYRPYGNSSVALNTNNTTIDDWFKTIRAILK